MYPSKKFFESKGYVISSLPLTPVMGSLPLAPAMRPHVQYCLPTNTTCHKDWVNTIMGKFLIIKLPRANTNDFKEKLKEEIRLLSIIKNSAYPDSKDSHVLSRFCLIQDFDSDTNSWFVMDAVIPPITLKLFIEQYTPENVARSLWFSAHIFLELYLTIEFLHRVHTIAHRNIRPENILLNFEDLVDNNPSSRPGLPKIKLIDFQGAVNQLDFGVGDAFTDVKGICSVLSGLLKGNCSPEQGKGYQMLAKLCQPPHDVTPFKDGTEFADFMTAASGAWETRFTLQNLGKKGLQFARAARDTRYPQAMNVFKEKSSYIGTTYNPHFLSAAKNLMVISESDPKIMVVKPL